MNADAWKASSRITTFGGLWSPENDFLDLHISDVMNASPETILAEIKAIEALEMMRGFDKPIAVLPVVDSEAPGRSG